MKSFFRLVFLVLFLAGWGLAALSLHVVRAQGDKIVLIPKDRLSVQDTYVDARNWTAQDVADHPALIKRILQSGKAEQFTYVTGSDSGDITGMLEQALKDAQNAPPTTQKGGHSLGVEGRSIGGKHPIIGTRPSPAAGRAARSFGRRCPN